ELFFVGDDPIVDHRDRHAQRLARLTNRGPARVRAVTSRRLVAHGDDGQANLSHGRMHSPLLPPALCSNLTLPMLIARSTALHMSYTVSAATAAAVRASISTPVRLLTRTVARISRRARSISRSKVMSTPLIGSG